MPLRISHRTQPRPDLGPLMLPSSPSLPTGNVNTIWSFGSRWRVFFNQDWLRHQQILLVSLFSTASWLLWFSLAFVFIVLEFLLLQVRLRVIYCIVLGCLKLSLRILSSCLKDSLAGSNNFPLKLKIFLCAVLRLSLILVCFPLWVMCSPLLSPAWSKFHLVYLFVVLFSVLLVMWYEDFHLSSTWETFFCIYFSIPHLHFLYSFFLELLFDGY